MQTSKIIIFVFAVIISVNSYAQLPGYKGKLNSVAQAFEPASFLVNLTPANSGTSFNLEIHNPDLKKLRLQVSHRDLGTIIDTIIHKPHFSQRYNMEQVEDGRYTISVSTKKEILVREIEINTITKRDVRIF